MSKESYRKEVQRRLLALQKHPAYQGNADAWGKAVAAFSARCALRAFPLLTQSGDLIFWTYKEQRQHFIAVEACLLGTSCWAINHIHLHNQLRAAATAAGADSKVAYSSSSAYAAVFAVSAAYFAAVAVDTAAFSVSSAYSEGAASNASNAADAAFDAAGAADATAAAAYAYAVATADLTQLEADNTDLFQLPLWPGGIPGRIQKILDGPWNQVLSSIDSQATATRYQGFLDGKPDWGACQKAFQEWAEEHA